MAKLFRESLSVVSELREGLSENGWLDYTYLILRAAIIENSSAEGLQLSPDAESERRNNTYAHGLSQVFCHALGWSAEANEGLQQILNNARH